MTAKQAEKEARIVAAEFEWQIETGFIADDRQTFEKYALAEVTLLPLLLRYIENFFCVFGYSEHSPAPGSPPHIPRKREAGELPPASRAVTQ